MAARPEAFIVKCRNTLKGTLISVRRDAFYSIMQAGDVLSFWKKQR